MVSQKQALFKLAYSKHTKNSLEVPHTRMRTLNNVFVVAYFFFCLNCTNETSGKNENYISFNCQKIYSSTCKPGPRLWLYDQITVTNFRYFQAVVTKNGCFGVFRPPRPKFGIYRVCRPRPCGRKNCALKKN